MPGRTWQTFENGLLDWTVISKNLSVKKPCFKGTSIKWYETEIHNYVGLAIANYD